MRRFLQHLLKLNVFLKRQNMQNFLQQHAQFVPHSLLHNLNYSYLHMETLEAPPQRCQQQSASYSKFLLNCSSLNIFFYPLWLFGFDIQFFLVCPFGCCSLHASCTPPPPNLFFVPVLGRVLQFQGLFTNPTDVPSSVLSWELEGHWLFLLPYSNVCHSHSLKATGCSCYPTVRSASHIA